MMCRKIIQCLLVVGVASVTAGCVAYYFIGVMLEREARLRSSPVAQRLAAKMSAATDQGSSPEIVIFGDSRAEMWQPGWSVTTVNFGVSGATAEELYWALHAAPTFDYSNCTVIIQLGINDLKSVEYSGLAPEMLARDVADKVLWIRQRVLAQGASQVRILGVWPVGKVPLWRKPFWSADVEVARLEVNQLLSDELPKEDYQVPPTGLNQSDYLDLLHFASSGYRKIEESIRANGLKSLDDKIERGSSDLQNEDGFAPKN